MGKRDRFDLVGNTIAGTFRVDELVAEGGFGVVYRAFHLHFRSPVALKCLKIPEELTDEERHEFLEQFRSEAEIMFRLSASLPQVVRPLHVDAVHSTTGEFVPLMALEWLDGKSFEAIIHERERTGRPPMSLTEAVELITPAAQALDAAHHFEGNEGPMGIVHRDIKPDNLFLTEVGGRPQVKILDFGISKVRRAATELAGRASQTSGQAPFSPAYGAPEQWVPKRYGQTGPWTDVWGLALTLVEIIKGGAVIVGDHQAMMGTALDPHVRPTPRTEDVEVSDEVERVFKKAMTADPRFRYQSVKAFWEALQHALVIGGDPTQHQEGESGARFALPPMIAPTPWAAPPSSNATVDEEPYALPPMLDPAPLEKSQPEELAVEALFPNDPESGLSPVLPAAHDEPPVAFEIPHLEEEPPPADAALATAAGAAAALELQPTSAFPPAVGEAARARNGREMVLELATEELTPAHRPFDLAPVLSDSELPLSGTEAYGDPRLPDAYADLPPGITPLDLPPGITPLDFPPEFTPAAHAFSPSSGQPDLSAPTRPSAPARRVVTRKESSADLPAVPDLTPPAISANRGRQRSPKPGRGQPVGAPMSHNVSRPPPPRRAPPEVPGHTTSPLNSSTQTPGPADRAGQKRPVSPTGEHNSATPNVPGRSRSKARTGGS